jgi:hypothetical protein
MRCALAPGPAEGAGRAEGGQARVALRATPARIPRRAAALRSCVARAPTD